jgi:hypothetical protein
MQSSVQAYMFTSINQATYAEVRCFLPAVNISRPLSFNMHKFKLFSLVEQYKSLAVFNFFQEISKTSEKY